MSVFKKLLVAAGVMLATLTASAVPAAAAVTPSIPGQCFGSSGNFATGTILLHPDWNSDGIFDECLGIAPNRHIYHAWPRHPWQLMPNGGLADTTIAWGWVFVEDSTGSVAILSNTFKVGVHGKPPYCATLDPFTNAWSSWYQCQIVTFFLGGTN